jgi:hypothetical protein
MKKAILIILISGFIESHLNGQNLLDIYKKGPVKLTPEKTYGAKNNWESMFNLYYDTLTKNVGREEDKKIVVAPDGSVFMSHRNRHEIWKFGADGSFNKKIGMKGGHADQFPMMPDVQAIVDGKYVLTSDVNARLKFFDLEGAYYKSINLTYMTDNFQPLGNGQLLLHGHVMWKDNEPGTKYTVYRWRNIIVKLDISSGTEKIIYDFFEEPNAKYLNTKNRDSMQMISINPPGKIYMPNYVLFRRPVFTLFPNGQVTQSNRGTGDIKLINETGKEISSFKLDIKPLEVTEKDALENYESTFKMLNRTRDRALALPDNPESSLIGNTGKRTVTFPDKKEILLRTDKALTRLDELKNLTGYYPFLPYFSNIIVDDEGNMLVFEFTRQAEKKSNVFNVIAYDNKGQKLARTSFICDDYDLSFSESTFVISKGYVYAVAKLKNTTGMPLRLVKFKISN